MTLWDVLDVAYAMRVEAHERTALALVSGGALSPEQLFEVRDAFDTDLEAAPAAVSSVVDLEQRQLREALGVA